MKKEFNTIKNEGLHLEYCTSFLEKESADKLFQSLERDLEYFSRDLSRVKVFGKWHDIPRKQVAFGDEGLTYKYSGLSVSPLPWPEPLRQLRAELHQHLGQDYNFVLVNRYADGNDYMGEHRDDEKELDKEAGIASVSLGAERPFVFRHVDAKFKRRSIPTIKMTLHHGSCLVMKYPTNEYWYHGLPKRKGFSTRINLTFRNVLKVDKKT